MIFVYDIASQESYDDLVNWDYQLKKVVKEIPVVTVANKLDLVDISEVPETRFPTAYKFKANFFTVSAKTGDRINDAFQYLGKQMVKNLSSE